VKHVHGVGKSHDAFRSRGLGKDTLRVWCYLDAVEVMQAKALAVALGRPLSVIYYHLSKLKQHGLAVKSGSGYVRAGAAILDQVAEALGVAGVGAAQKTKHTRDRRVFLEEYARRLEERRHRAEADVEAPKEEQVSLEAQPKGCERVLAVVQGVFECEVVTVLNSAVSVPARRGGMAAAEAVTLPESSGWPQALLGLGPRHSDRYTPCARCATGTHVVYGGTALCRSCAVVAAA
jgi:hypothetical protein